MKKTLFIVSLVGILIILFVVYKFLSASKPTNINPVTTPTPTIPQGATIEISGTPLNNIYKGSKIDNQRDVFFIDEPGKYQVVFLEKFNTFLISILGSPFEELRQDAEKALLIKTGLSQAEACKLDIQTTTPSYVNPDYAGRSYPLSFCE
jgi:hypothetical protein